VTNTTGTDCIDADSDGVCAEDDCNDNYNLAYEGATEIPYNGLDEDCDGEDLVDYDNDGHDADFVGGDDCNDGNPEVYPGAPEECYYALQDYNCDEQFGGDDCDFDGYDRYEDCDDENPSAYPGAKDPWYNGVDEDCEGNSDYDMDYDGDDSDEHGGLDCDEANPLVGGALPELLDGFDNDCDDIVDVIYHEDASQTYDASTGVGDYVWGGGIANMGDLDGDGLAEIAVGDLGKSDIITEAIYVGGVYVVSSAEEGRPDDVALASISGVTDYDTMGWALSSGDIDGDGTRDLLVGASFVDTTYLFMGTQLMGGVTLGAADAHASLLGGGGYAGGEVEFMDDITGDGLPEVLTATRDYDTAWLALHDGASVAAGGTFSSGAALAYLSDNSAVIGDIASGGDLNADGVADLLVACSSCSSQGLLYLFDGTTLTGGNIVNFSDYEKITVTSTLAAEGYAMTTGILDDHDGDGYPEVVVADPFVNKMAGQVWVMSASAFGSGGDIGSHATFSVSGENEEGMLRVPNTFSDQDGDGLDDLIIGEPGTYDTWSAKQGDFPPQGAGSVHWFSSDAVMLGGDVTASEADGVFHSGTSYVAFGVTMDSEDINGDGLGDIAIGASMNASGKLYLFNTGF
jgi:hypothetical protein